MAENLIRKYNKINVCIYRAGEATIVTMLGLSAGIWKHMAKKKEQFYESKQEEEGTT